MMNKYKEIHRVIAHLDLPDYRYEQIIKAIFRQGVVNYACMNMLPRHLRDALISEFGESVSCVNPVTETASNQVGKVLLALPDGNQIEAVSLSYKRGWESFCISSQCGCGFGCRFCATGAAGFKRNLTSDEITDQLLYFRSNGRNLDNVSFMGMGEPLSNPNVFDALSVLTDATLFGLSQRKITVSTIGIIPSIQRMTREFPQVNLAFSLHSPFENQRSSLMPVNRKYPLQDVMKALDEHIQRTGRKVFIAYILLDGINDSEEHARAVAKLLRGRGSRDHLYHVDLIPYNPTDKTLQKFRASNYYCMNRFRENLKYEGINVTVRAQFGSDINAACGQLYGKEVIVM